MAYDDDGKATGALPVEGDWIEALVVIPRIEEATLRQVREARERSQEEVAKKLHIKQAAVSKLERRTDMYLSTLRGFIEAMGGKLEIVARFPNRAVRITQFEMLDPEQRRQG